MSTSLSPDIRQYTERFFTMVKSIHEFDQVEVRTDIPSGTAIEVFARNDANVDNAQGAGVIVPIAKVALPRPQSTSSRDTRSAVPQLGMARAADTRKQEKLFYRIFPKQVDAGARKSTTLDWMLTRTADTTKQTAPRELIHLLSSARDTQLKMLELGVPGPPEEALFDRTSLKDAMPEVSKVRFEQTLCAEYPNLKPFLMKLEREKTQQTPETLARIWDVGLDKAIALAESLTEVGFFERRGTKDRPTFWVPFLYRDALDMIQGPAD